MRRLACQLTMFLSLAGSCMSLAGCSSNAMPGVFAYSPANASSQVSAPEQSARSGYVLHTNDQLHIQVYNEPTITGDYVVDGTGYLSIPVAGRLKASGLTTVQLERRLTAQLNSGILKDARVNIQIANYAPFYIHGEVKKPGEFPYKPGLTIADAVALAGGYTYRANEGSASVRPAGSAAEMTRSLQANPPVAPGDNIRIPERFL